MEYLHASLILHSAGKKITAKAVEDILNAAGVKPDTNRVKGLVSALNDVNIEEALESAIAMPTVATPAAAAAPAKAEAGKAQPAAAAAEPEEEEEEDDSGLSSLFG